jgi:hypothetical protein
LLADLLRRHPGEDIFWDLPATHKEANDLAKRVGLSPQRTLLRMCRGQPVAEDVLRLWASSGPELG